MTIDPASTGRTVPSGFLGLSLEYSAVEAYVGTDPAHINPVFTQLVRDLTPGQRPVLRIGGDSTDNTWWPTPGVTPPPGVTYALTPTWLHVVRALAQALRPRLLMGLNLEADSPELTAAEAHVFTDDLPAGSIAAWELGNEPELYRKFPYFRNAAGRLEMGRPPSYGFGAFQSDFIRISRSVPTLSFADPSIGGPGWMADIGGFLAAEPRVRIVAVHLYPLQLCFVPAGSPQYATVAHLLGPAASTGLADAFRAVIAAAAARRLPVRVDELNTVSCGADPKVSQSFASALWALDTLFEMLRVGVDGVNVHTFPGAGYDLFHFREVAGRWQGTVSPEYYGLLMFAEAAPAGSRLVGVRAHAGSSLKLWATRAPNGTVRVVLINKSQTRARVVRLDLSRPGASATLERLQAPSAGARTGVTLGGRSFAPGTETGTLAGRPSGATLTPADGAYMIAMPAASAALLTLASG